MRTIKILACLCGILLQNSCSLNKTSDQDTCHSFNSAYSGKFLDRIAFPMGGMGAGMVCLEGNACISHVSVRHMPDVYNEPYMFGALAIKGLENASKVLEGPVQSHKIYGGPHSGNGNSQQSYGFPRFEQAEFKARFPFGTVNLSDPDIPLDISISGWSPFIPGDEDNSSLPVAGLEYTFMNQTDSILEMVFSYHSENFMRIRSENIWGITYPEKGHHVQKMRNGFMLSQECFPDKPHYKGDFSISTLEDAHVDYRWFRGGWYDAPTQLWNDVQNLNLPADTATAGSVGASLYVPMKLSPGETRTVHLLFAWHVPHSMITFGTDPADLKPPVCDPSTGCCSSDYTSQFYEPWYYERFSEIHAVNKYWRDNYQQLKSESEKFSSALFASDLPAEVLEAVSANLSILKSPTVLRQRDGKLWAYEGCFDQGSGCCNGSCTHVWNYAQAIPHLFPRMERSLRETEFKVSQDEKGHQNFRSALPIQSTDHGWHAAADGQLGGIIKVYRDWRISGDTEWVRSLWPSVKASFDFCSSSWDPLEKGILEEPHHNTYDIEFWGPDGMCTSIYLGACKAMEEMAMALGEESEFYARLLQSGSSYMEDKLYNGEYFFQETTWEGLQTPPPDVSASSWNINYSEEALEILEKEGPKYQYGMGCLSDGIIGAWFGAVGGLPPFIDQEKVKSHLGSVYAYNFRTDLSDHINPQRSGFGLGKEGGLLLCSWPKGKQPALPFVYSNEVWTGIEYQVASHLMMMGEVDKGLDIVRAARQRYDGTIRNPFNEYECGHWYARALASYSLLQGLTGLRYDALEKTLYINSRLGKDFKCFLSTETGYGLAGLSNGTPFLEVVSGIIEVDRFLDQTGEN